MTTETPTLTRLRIRYAKGNELRYTGHLDMHRLWERTLRRAGLPLAYSQGFHPQPRINQACALPLGFTSREEVIDIWFDGDQESASAARTIQHAAPPGIQLLQVEQVDLRAQAIQTEVVSAEYDAMLLDNPDGDAIQAKIDTLLASPTLSRERRGKTYDLRPLIEHLELISPNDMAPLTLRMRLSAREGATGRPEEVLEALGQDAFASRVERTKIIFKSGSA